MSVANPEHQGCNGMIEAGQDNSSADIWTQRITRWLTVFIRFFSAHWLLMANVAVALYVGLPILAPVLMYAGHERVANAIYVIFRPLCHQLPERSFFFFGQDWVYSYEELSRFTGGAVPQRWIGGVVVGFKTAVCQRDVAIYLSMLMAGIIFHWLRNRLKPLSIKGFILMLVPIAIDGFGQLFGAWASSWWSRVVTGTLFGVAMVWLAYPYLQRGMSEVHAESARTIAEWKG